MSQEQDEDSDIEVLNDIVDTDDDELEIIPNPSPSPINILDLSSTQNDIPTDLDYPSEPLIMYTTIRREE